jgi:hypothetical protein
MKPPPFKRHRSSAMRNYNEYATMLTGRIIPRHKIKKASFAEQKKKMHIESATVGMHEVLNFI